MPIILTREMFSITSDGARAEIKIWRRPDLDSAAGARNAEEMAAEAAKLPHRGIREVILDLREAPGVAGPRRPAGSSRAPDAPGLRRGERRQRVTSFFGLAGLRAKLRSGRRLLRASARAFTPRSIRRSIANPMGSNSVGPKPIRLVRSSDDAHR